MHSLGKTVNELHAMLKLHEQTLTLPKNNAPALMQFEQPQDSSSPKREEPTNDSICHECGKTCHWKRNYPQYLAGLLKKKKNAASGADGSEASGSREDLKIIQEQDTHPSIDTSSNHEEDDLEIDEPQSDIISLFVGPQGHDVPQNHMCLNIDGESIENTKDMFLVYGGDLKRELMVSCYTDAGYLTDVDDLKSQTGYVFILNGEAEYIAAYDASKEAVWVRKFIYRLGVVPIIKEPISMYCDNTGAITITNKSGITKGARHFHAKVHYLIS
ncbi:hypothetical protein Tco_0437814 [Tanacetum coccineum]